MKKTNKKRSKIDGGFTALENKLTDSIPWKDLSIHGRYLYFEIKKKWAGRDRTHIVFTHKEAREFMAENTFRKARNKLIEKGFIDMVNRGGLWGQEAVFALSDRWKKWGKKDFKEVNMGRLFPKSSHFFKKGHKFCGKE